MLPSTARVTRLAVTALALFCSAFTATASASHEQGGHLNVAVTADGHLTGSLSYLQTSACTVGTSTGTLPITIKSPLGSTAVANTKAGKYSRCVPNSATMSADIDVDLAAAFSGAAPDGQYVVTFSTCCRVAGIRNISTTDTTFSAAARKAAERAAASPVFGSTIAFGVAKGYRYSQYLNASDPDGGALTYASRAGQPGGPSTDVIVLDGDEVTIPAATTATFADNQFYVYKVRVGDDQGDYSERDVLLRVTDRNVPPELTGLDASTPYRLQAGTTRTITVTAADGNAAAPKVDTVAITGAGLPSWAELTTTAGNPATATLKLSPPVATPASSFGINFDAVDNDSIVPLSAAANITVEVTPPEPAAKPVIATSPAEASSSPTATFAFSAENAAWYECRLDDGVWATCTSPFSVLGLADGSHTLHVRGVSSAGLAGEPAVRTWQVDTTPTGVPAPAPAAPGPVPVGQTPEPVFLAPNAVKAGLQILLPRGTGAGTGGGAAPGAAPTGKVETRLPLVCPPGPQGCDASGRIVMHMPVTATGKRRAGRAAAVQPQTTQITVARFSGARIAAGQERLLDVELSKPAIRDLQAAGIERVRLTLTIDNHLGGGPTIRTSQDVWLRLPQNLITCVSRRQMTIHWRVPEGAAAARFAIAVDGRRAASLPATARQYRVDLRGRPAAEVNVVVSTRDAGGRRLMTSRTFQTCAVRAERGALRSVYLTPLR